LASLDHAALNATLGESRNMPAQTAAVPQLDDHLRPRDLAKKLGVSLRTIERERAAGRFPEPTLRIGRCVAWSTEVIRQWVAAQAATQ